MLQCQAAGSQGEKLCTFDMTYCGINTHNSTVLDNDTEGQWNSIMQHLCGHLTSSYHHTFRCALSDTVLCFLDNVAQSALKETRGVC